MPCDRAESAYLFGPSKAQKSLLQAACPQDTMPIPPWRMLGLTTSQSSRSYLRQNTYARATNFTLGLTGRCDCSVPLLATPALCSFTNPERLTEYLPYVLDPRRGRKMTILPP